MARGILSLSLLALVTWLFTAIQVSARSIPALQTSPVIRIEDWYRNISSPYSSPHKRAGKEPLTWEQAVNKGKGLLCNLKLLDTPPDPKTGKKKTVWTGSDLNKYWSSVGYHIGNVGVSDSTNNVADALNGLGLTPNFPPNKGFYYEQDQDWWEDKKDDAGNVIDSIRKDATYGYYTSVMNPANGLILAESNTSPWEETRNDDQREPPLTKWSDVNFLFWKLAAGNNAKDVRNLKYFFRFHIINTDTKNMIDLALEKAKKTLTEFPGTTFSMKDDAGKAILGSPNGGGVAWFLVDHKGPLGVKTVDSVQVFKTTGRKATTGTEDWYHAVFNIKAA